MAFVRRAAGRSAVLLGFSAGCVSHTVRTAVDSPLGGGDDVEPAPPEPVAPVKCVIVGGGYGGARTAYQLDSIYHVTLIDTKNYYEATDDLTNFLTGPDEFAAQRLSDLHALHRYYLRRARVLTNRVVDVEEKEVVLADGRRVPFDVLVLAVGETRPYPLAPTAVTVDVREKQLWAFRRLLKHDAVKRIAVIGGGPKGVSVSNCLTSMHKDKTVDLFHSTSTLAPSLPYEARERFHAMFEANPCVTTHLNHVVTDVSLANPEEIKPLELTVERQLAAHEAFVKAEKEKEAKLNQRGFWATLFGGSAKGTVGTNVQQEQQLLKKGAASSSTKAAPAAEVGVSEQQPAGLPPDQSTAADAPDPYAACPRPKFNLKTITLTPSKIETQSVLRQAWCGTLPSRKVSRGDPIGTAEFDGYDLVLNCAGNIPNARQFENSKLLGPHLDANGRIITSKFLQLHGRPNFFAVGRSTNLKWVRSMGSSDYQAKSLFRNLLSVASISDVSATARSLVPTLTPVLRTSMSFPRLIVPMDELQAVGSTGWTGTVKGPMALKEMTQDRSYYLKEFHKPVFFKQLDDGKVRKSFETFMSAAATDPTDFDLSDD